MVDKQNDDIFELTEDMASTPPPESSDESDENEKALSAGLGSTEKSTRRQSAPTDSSKSPFPLLAEPSSLQSERVVPETRRESRPSFQPTKSNVPVVAMPIRKLSKTGHDEGKQIFDLGHDMIVEVDDNQFLDQPDSVPPETEAEDSTHELSEFDELEATQKIKKVEAPGVAEKSEGSGAAEQVIDEIPLDVDHADKEEPEEIDLEGAEEITEKEAPLEVEVEVEIDESELAKKDKEEDEEEEEIDIIDVEEVTRLEASPMPAVQDKQATLKPPRVRRRRKKAKEWWADIFDDDYLTLVPKVTHRDARRRVDFIEKNLNVPKNSLLLDLACGSGYHAVGMAARGYRIVGVDLSLPMLARAGELAQETDQKINFIHGDMRDLGFDKTFDAIYCVGTSFGFFDEKTNLEVLKGIARALKPRAPFLLEVANRDHVITRQPNLIWFEGDGSVCIEETSFNFINSRLYVTRQLIMGEGGRQVKHTLSLRLYSLHELGTMLTKAGLKVTHVSGHPATSGAFFGHDSSQIIILASRRK